MKSFKEWSKEKEEINEGLDSMADKYGNALAWSGDSKGGVVKRLANKLLMLPVAVAIGAFILYLKMSPKAAKFFGDAWEDFGRAHLDDVTPGEVMTKARQHGGQLKIGDEFSDI
jgi:hypothetical protein